MVTDRKVTKRGVDYDPDANKNVLFSDKNGVVAVGYTGMAYIGTIPTDRWIAQTLTGLTFPEGRRGRGSVPFLMTTDYEDQYLGLRLRHLRDQLNEIRPLILKQHRNAWSTSFFEVLVTGFEWNHGVFRPVLAALSKPANSDAFQLSTPPRHWYLAQRGRFLAQMVAAPSENLPKHQFQIIDAQLESKWGHGRGTPAEIAEHAERLFSATIRDVSAKLNVVGPDTMSILIPAPAVPGPTIQVRYVSAGRDRGVIVAGDKQAPVPVAFTPWIISRKCIRSPSVFANTVIEAPCGPYRVVMGTPRAPGLPSAISSQERRQVE